jgi:hypothetical protein
LDDLKETRRYWKLKEEAQDRNLWRTHSLEEAIDLSGDRQILTYYTSQVVLSINVCQVKVANMHIYFNITSTYRANVNKAIFNCELETMT